MTEKDTIEILARMWMECDPNRCGADPDAVMPEKISSGGTGMPTIEKDNPLAGQPRWRWFVPRAEATVSYLKSHGLAIVPLPRD